jgi:uncharacterized protein DUF3828
MSFMGFPQLRLGAWDAPRLQIRRQLSPSGDPPQECDTHRMAHRLWCAPHWETFEMGPTNLKNFAAVTAAVLLYKQLASIERMMMLTRRNLGLVGLVGLLAANDIRATHAEPASVSDPVAIVTAIYTGAAKGKGDGGGGFVYQDKAAKAKYLSKSLTELWARADKHTPKDEVGPVDFDPVTNSQDPDVGSFKVTSEKLEANGATVAATFTSRHTTRKSADDFTVRYDFVRDGAAWKIDDIRGSSDGERWSIRAMLANSLKH